MQVRATHASKQLVQKCAKTCHNFAINSKIKSKSSSGKETNERGVWPLTFRWPRAHTTALTLTLHLPHAQSHAWLFFCYCNLCYCYLNNKHKNKPVQSERGSDFQRNLPFLESFLHQENSGCPHNWAVRQISLEFHHWVRKHQQVTASYFHLQHPPK